MDISVIIPCYNCFKTIRKTLDTIKPQLEYLKEIIVVDDGSKIPLLLEEFSSQNKFRFIRKPNGGVSSARNHGIKNAISEYVAFIDSDDLWAADKISRQVEYLKQHKSLSWCFCKYKDENGEYTLLPRKARQVLEEKGFFESYVDMALWGVPHQTSGLIVKRELLIEAGLYDENLNAAEDLDLYFRISSIDSKVGYIDDVLYVYQEGIPDSQAKSPNRVSDAVQSLIKLSEKYSAGSIKDSFNMEGFKRYADNSIFRALLHYYSGLQNLKDSEKEASLDILQHNRMLYLVILFYRLLPMKVRKRIGGRLRDLNRQLLCWTHN